MLHALHSHVVPRVACNVVHRGWCRAVWCVLGVAEEDRGAGAELPDHHVRYGRVRQHIREESQPLLSELSV